MNLYEVYSLMDIEPVKGEGTVITDAKGDEYLDFYGGHAVISIGHSHPTYVKNIQEQVAKIGFYSNSVQNPLQTKAAELLGEISGLEDYQLFFTNSGAESNENALKLASFYTGRKKVLSFKKGFHGRTSGAVATTDNPKVVAPFNAVHEVDFCEFEDFETAEKLLKTKEYCTVIIECIQGVGGINIASENFLNHLQTLCNKTGTLLITDEVQSGFARSGEFFAFQHYKNIEPDLIPMAKGMGNGFPVGGVLVHPKIRGTKGQLGTTFGGNHLACQATISVLETIKEENILQNTKELGEFLISELKTLSPKPKEVRGKGLMIGIEFDFPIKDLRTTLINKYKTLTGVASNPNVLRLLPPLNITKNEAEIFINNIKNALKDVRN